MKKPRTHDVQTTGKFTNNTSNQQRTNYGPTTKQLRTNYEPTTTQLRTNHEPTANQLQPIYQQNKYEQIITKLRTNREPTTRIRQTHILNIFMSELRRNSGQHTNTLPTHCARTTNKPRAKTNTKTLHKQTTHKPLTHHEQTSNPLQTPYDEIAQINFKLKAIKLRIYYQQTTNTLRSHHEHFTNTL